MGVRIEEKRTAPSKTIATNALLVARWSSVSITSDPGRVKLDSL
jgi:hypothetical protein